MLQKSPILDQCNAVLGGVFEPGAALGVTQTKLTGFELLQTPDLWGHDPSNNSYWLTEQGLASGPEPDEAHTRLHPAGQRFLSAIENIIAEGQVLVDLSSLESFPTGHFLTAIERGLTRLAATGRAVTVRFLFGVHPYTKNTNQGLAEFVERVTRGVDAGHCNLRIYACRQASSNEGLSSSWNHAKIVAADGRVALVGGHNLWSNDLVGCAPVHDLSAVFRGPGAVEAHRYLDQLWAWTARTPESAPPGPLNYTLAWYRGKVEPGVAAGPGVPEICLSHADQDTGVPALAVSRFGSGVVSGTPAQTNFGAAVVVAACRLARHSIRLSQMDFAFHFDKQSYWPREVMAALIAGLTDPDRRLSVQMVFSEPGGVAGSGGPYSFGETIEGIKQEFLNAIGTRPITGTFELARLRIHESGDRWTHHDKQWKITNHAKLWMVDDSLFHIGSDNIYPHNLQEFGYVVESPAWCRQVLDEYWNPMWSYSKRNAVLVSH